MRRNPTLKLQSTQSGMVSIIVTFIIMIVLTLIVVGFARLSRREQVQSVDRQLNSQAFYAAESAVNDVKQLFADNAVDLNGEYMTDCDQFIALEGLEPQLNNNIEYTCLFVDPSPTEIVTRVDIANSQVFPVEGKNGAAINSVTISWQPVDTGNIQASCPTTVGSFPATWPAACRLGVVRVELVPNDGALNRAELIGGTFTAFLYPDTSGTGSVAYTSGIGLGGAGNITSGNCSNDRCSVTITGLTLPNHYIRLSSIYRSSNVQISAENGSGPVELANAQSIVDATGRASDVLRRIQVRVSLSGLDGVGFPENALQTRSEICKRYVVAPPSTLLDPDGCGIN